MIRYSTIKKAKQGNEEAILKILNFYIGKIMQISNDDEFVQIASIEVYKGIISFKNISR